MKNVSSIAVVLLACLGTSVLLSEVARADEVSFARDIRPLFSDRCYKCHGPGTQKAGLRLDIRNEADWVFDIENPDESELLRRITSNDPDEVMPPHKGGTERLSEDQIARFRQWIDPLFDRSSFRTRRSCSF